MNYRKNDFSGGEGKGINSGGEEGLFFIAMGEKGRLSGATLS